MGLIYRREWMKSIAAGVGGLSLCNWLPAFADTVTQDPKRRRHCILLWMSGGPSQTDTFDMKPDHENGGEFKEIATNVPGVRFCEHLPLLAKQADQLAIVRSLQTKEGDHARGTYLMRTGQKPMSTITYPSIGCALGKELGRDSDSLPRYVSVAPYQALDRQAHGPGFLGPKYASLIVDSYGSRPTVIANPNSPVAAAAGGFAELKINALDAPQEITKEQITRRRELLSLLQKEFVERKTGAAARAHDTTYERSINMMTKETAEAFDLSKEPEKLRESYGKGVFGQGCLMARRLVERGVPVVEVGLNGVSGGGMGWDTHANIFASLKPMLSELDAGWSTLMTDLKDRGLLESTTIIWMGEFGRTPKINANGGRDHFPAAWSCVFAGGGIKGGQVIGRTSKDGNKIEDRPIESSDILTTLVKAVGVNPAVENLSNIGRPIKIMEGNEIKEILA